MQKLVDGSSPMAILQMIKASVIPTQALAFKHKNKNKYGEKQVVFPQGVLSPYCNLLIINSFVALT